MKKLILNSIFFTISFLGILIHSSWITNSYLKYQTVTGVNVERNRLQHGPAISFCIKLWDISSYGRHDKYWSNANDQDINQHTANISSFISPSYVIVKQFYHWRFKCLKLIGRPFSLITLMDAKLNFSTFINQSESISILVLIHSQDTFPFFTEADSFMQDIGYDDIGEPLDNWFSYGLDTIVTSYLESPFPDRCQTYGNEFKYRGPCLSKCIDEFIKRKGISSTCNDDRVSDKFIRWFGNETIQDVARKSCLINCPVNCTSNSYFPVLIHQKHSGLDGLFQISIIRSRPLITIRNEPAMPIDNFIIYLCGILGIWFGFNVFDFSHRLNKFVHQFLKHEQISKTNEPENLIRRIAKLQVVSKNQFALMANQMRTMKEKIDALNRMLHDTAR